jgi:hypothetical protein
MKILMLIISFVPMILIMNKVDKNFYSKINNGADIDKENKVRDLWMVVSIIVTFITVVVLIYIVNSTK